MHDNTAQNYYDFNLNKVILFVSQNMFYVLKCDTNNFLE